MNPADIIPKNHPSPADMASRNAAHMFEDSHTAYAAGIAAERARLASMLLVVSKALLTASREAGPTVDGFRAQGATELAIVLGEGLSS